MGEKIEAVPFKHPYIDEILAQQRIMLEILSELMKHMAQPSYIMSSPDEESPIV